MSAPRETLECSHEDFHALSVAVDRARKGSVSVSVPKVALEALIRDHGKLIRLYRGEIGGIT